jgi:PiT family inorganic phosphate transporter
MSKLDILIPLLALIATHEFLTGVFGASSIVATMIASNAIKPRRAILLSTLAQFVGPFLFGVAVATTVGSEVVEPRILTPNVLYAALSATVFWMLFVWCRRIPSSSTHALIGGLVGAVLAARGPAAIHESGLLKILLSLTLTVPLGIFGGFLLTRLCSHLCRWMERPLTRRFNQGQFVSSVFLGLAVGSTNAQNGMGITALCLVTTGFLPHFEVPYWVVAASAGLLALGNLIGGMRLIQTVGMKFFQVEPVHGFSAQVSSTAIIIASAALGGGISTTHVTSMSIVGAGAAEQLSMVRWEFVRKVMLTWVITIPLTAVLAVMFYIAFNYLGIH